jgi:hypothetical protein
MGRESYFAEGTDRPRSAEDLQARHAVAIAARPAVPPPQPLWRPCPARARSNRPCWTGLWRSTPADTRQRACIPSGRLVPTWWPRPTLRVLSAFAALWCDHPGCRENRADGRWAARIGMKTVWTDGPSAIELSLVEFVLQTGLKARCDYPAASREPVLHTGDPPATPRGERGRAKSGHIKGGGPIRPRSTEVRELARPPQR